MIDAYIAGVDAAMAAHFTPEMVAAMKIRDRIRSMIWFRLETMAPAREALRSGAGDPRHAAECAARRCASAGAAPT